MAYGSSDTGDTEKSRFQTGKSSRPKGKPKGKPAVPPRGKPKGK